MPTIRWNYALVRLSPVVDDTVDAFHFSLGTRTDHAEQPSGHAFRVKAISSGSVGSNWSMRGLSHTRHVGWRQSTMCARSLVRQLRSPTTTQRWNKNDSFPPASVSFSRRVLVDPLVGASLDLSCTKHSSVNIMLGYVLDLLEDHPRFEYSKF